MNTGNNKKLEKTLYGALELREKGKSIPEILNVLPGFKEELGEIFRVIEALSHEREKNIPSKDMLTRIISRIAVNEGVTNKESVRYFSYGAVTKGRSPIVEALNQIHNYMTSKLKILFAIGVVAAVLVLVIVGARQKASRLANGTDQTETAANQPPTQQQQPSNETSLPPLQRGGTSKNLVDQLIQASDPQAAVQEEARDSNAISTGNSSITEAGKSE